jgi:hypothetical protein
MPQITKQEQDVVDALTKGVKGQHPDKHVTLRAGDVATLCRLVVRAKFDPAPEPVDELNG